MRFTAYTLIALYLLCSEMASAHSIPDINYNTCFKTPKQLKDHVEFLSSAALEGRLTGSPGEKLATEYVAKIFHCLGLEPAGDKGTFFQEFTFISGVSFEKNNSFLISNQKGQTKNLRLGQEWQPLSFSDTISFESKELIFAGYGITAPALGKLPAYDSYQGLDVQGKWVVVFRYTPEKISEEQSRQLSQYISPRYKAFTAKDHGAKGIIFVSGPNSKVKNELIPLSFDASLSGSGIVAISVQDMVLEDLLKNRGSEFNSLASIQDKLDSGQPNATPRLTKIKIKGQIDIKQNKKHARNVLAKLKVNQSTTQALVIGAHVDHLGRGEMNSSLAGENEKGRIHYGSDDNASGVASVLAAAASLSDMKARNNLPGNKDILFAIWSGEELGLLGSAYFVKDFMAKTPNKPLRSALNANINLDMVGRLRKNLVLQGIGSSSSWLKFIEQVNKKHSIPLITQTDPYLPTDSTSFYLQGVPTLNFFTGSHEEYHSSRDRPETLNYQGMNSISAFLIDLILALEEQPNSIDYRHIAKSEARHGGGFRVYFGTIPDYASADISGVKLSGVTKNSPAEHAGIKANDIIIKVAGKKIHDLYDYTFVLRALHVGDSVPLVILREQKKIALKIVARSRE